MMEKDEDAYSHMVPQGNFAGLEYYSMDPNVSHHHQTFIQEDAPSPSPADYVLHHHHQPHEQTVVPLAHEAMQFADFGNKMANVWDEYNSMDDDLFYFPNDRSPPQPDPPMLAFLPSSELGMLPEESRFGEAMVQVAQEVEDDHQRLSAGDKEKGAVRIRLPDGGQNNCGSSEGKGKRKRPRRVMTAEEVESRRMAHVVGERNRRKQNSERLSVLRSLLPISSYVEKKDQASTIDGAIEYLRVLLESVRALEQRVQSLESEKRRRLDGGDNAGPPRPMGEAPAMGIQGSPPQFLPHPPLSVVGDQAELMNFDTWLLDVSVEVKLLGFDAFIKILSRSRAGQLRKMIAALEDLQLNILQFSKTTREQSVLYFFHVKVTGDGRITEEDIANSVHQILNFIHASATIYIWQLRFNQLV